MSVREIDAYSTHAYGSGCFFNRDSQQRINDPDTGQLRRERVFTSDVMIEVGDEPLGVIEFGERFAAEIAHVLGWVSPQAHAKTVQQATDMEMQRNTAVAAQAAAEAASEVNLAQTAKAVASGAELKDQVEALQAQLASANGKLGSLTKQLKDAQEQIVNLTDFGDD